MDGLNEERMEESYDEGDLSDDDFEELSFNDLVDRLGSNSPSLTTVKLCNSDIVNGGNLAAAIGRNTHVKAMMFDDLMFDGVSYGEQIYEAQAANVFRNIACSRSIKRLHFYDCGEYIRNACHILTPLFKNNQVERVRIDNFDTCDLNTECIRLLTTSLTEFDSLKEFALTQARIQHRSQEVLRDLVQSLSGHSGLRKIDLSNTDVGKLGCSELVDLLRNPNIKLRVLDLSCNNLGDAETIALSSGMAGNVSLTEVNLAGNRSITETGWQALFDHLSTSCCRLEKLTLGYNYINDAAAQSLSNALARSTTLKTLSLCRIRGISPTVWNVLLGSLRNPTCVLEDLNLSSTLLIDEAMTSLITVLTGNRSLKSLNLSWHDGVTGAGWQRFVSTVIANPNSGLEKLDLQFCDNINDAAIRALIDVLVNNSKLKVLDLSHNQVTNAGWERFSSVLESPNTALEELDLAANEIHDATLTSLMNSLANNKELKKLRFRHSEDWSPPLSVFCNSDSIMDTYNSNHILEKLGNEDDLPEEFESLLQINRENSPSQAARLKIIKTHFNEGFTIQPFVDMDLNVLPHAMAWMGRDEVNGHFYGFIKSISSLFENAK